MEIYGLNSPRLHSQAYKKTFTQISTLLGQLLSFTSEIRSLFPRGVFRC